MGPIEFSQEALEALKQQTSMSSVAPKAVRLGVRGGACNGLQYVIEFDHDDARPGDIEWSVDDVMFRIDKKSVLYLQGTRIVWAKTLMKQGFQFENPNEASHCGCGHSFSAK